MIRKLLTLLPPVSLKITDTLYSVVVSIRMQIVFFWSLIATLFSKIWSISVNLSSGHFPHDGIVAKSQGKTFESRKVCTDLWSSQGKVQSQLNLVQSLFLMNDVSLFTVDIVSCRKASSTWFVNEILSNHYVYFKFQYLWYISMHETCWFGRIL